MVIKMKYGKLNNKTLALAKKKRGRDGLTDSQRINRQAYKQYTNAVECNRMPKAKNGKPYKTPARAIYFLTISGRLHELKGGEKDENKM